MLNAYYSNSFTPFFVFFALFLAVVRNEKLPHFLRFNAMQSILLDICIMLGARPPAGSWRRVARLHAAGADVAAAAHHALR